MFKNKKYEVKQCRLVCGLPWLSGIQPPSTLILHQFAASPNDLMMAAQAPAIMSTSQETGKSKAPSPGGGHIPSDIHPTCS